MKNIQHIEISKIKMDSYPVSAQTLDIAMKIKSGELNVDDLPPILVMFVNGTYYIKDGRHRILALRMCGIETIKSKIFVPKVAVKEKTRKKHIRHKFYNAINLFEKTMMLETREVKRISKTYFFITASDGKQYAVDLKTNKVHKYQSDTDYTRYTSEFHFAKI